MAATVALASLLAALLAGCTADIAYRKGNDLEAQDKLEASLVKYREALSAAPSNVVYKIAYLRARDKVNNRLLTKADQQHTALPEDAGQKLGAIPTQPSAYEPIMSPPSEAELAAAFSKPISLELRDATLKQIFALISRHSGLNFLLDREVKTDQRTSIFLRNTTVEMAVYYLLMTNQLERQVLDGNTILIYPNIAVKQKEYQEIVVKTFYLANAEAKDVANTLKTILQSRDVVADERLNLVIVRDTPEAVELASRLVMLQDIPEPEVMLDVEILETQRSRLLDLGVDWPTSLSFAPLTNANDVPLTIDRLRGLNGSAIGVTGALAAITAKKTDGGSKLLAAPRIRVRNKEKAKIVIGDKLPTFTTMSSSGVRSLTSESVNYIDVGLTLNVEPTIYLNNEVGIHISLEVSNLVDTIESKSGATAYRIGTRTASTTLQLKDGENQVLAGLVKSDDRSSGVKMPMLGDVPLLGRLFGSAEDHKEQTEVVLSITPHLVRNVQRASAAASEFNAGTETNFRRRPKAVVSALELDNDGAQLPPLEQPSAVLTVPNADANAVTSGAAFDGNDSSPPPPGVPEEPAAPAGQSVLPPPPPPSTPPPNWP